MQLSVALEEKNILKTKQLDQIQKTQLFQLLNLNNIDTKNSVLLLYLKENECIISTEIVNPKVNPSCS
jgi:outer membrane protein